MIIQRNTLENTRLLQAANWNMDGNTQTRNGWPQLLLWNKETQHPGINCCPQFNTITSREKMFFKNNYFGPQPFLMSCYFSKIFVHVSLITAVCYFSIYKLIYHPIGWDPENISVFNVSRKSIRKRCGICPQLKINTLQLCSGAFIVNSEHISHIF